MRTVHGDIQHVYLDVRLLAPTPGRMPPAARFGSISEPARGSSSLQWPSSDSDSPDPAASGAMNGVRRQTEQSPQPHSALVVEPATESSGTCRCGWGGGRRASRGFRATHVAAEGAHPSAGASRWQTTPATASAMTSARGDRGKKSFVLNGARIESGTSATSEDRPVVSRTAFTP